MQSESSLARLLALKLLFGLETTMPMMMSTMNMEKVIDTSKLIINDPKKLELIESNYPSKRPSIPTDA